MSLLDSATRCDLVLPTDTGRTFYFVFEDENGTALDDTGSTFDLTVKARNSSDAPTGSAVLNLSTGSGIAGDVSIGEFEPTIAKGALAAGSYIFEARRLVGGVAVEPVLVGLLDVVAGLS